MQANIGDQWTILFIAGIVTIRNPVTARCLEDTPLLGAIGTRPPIRILNSWELNITFAIAEGVSHVFAIPTKRLGQNWRG